MTNLSKRIEAIGFPKKLIHSQMSISRNPGDYSP